MTKGDNQGIMNNKKSQFSIKNDIMNDIVNDKKGQNIVNDSFAHKPDGLLVSLHIRSMWETICDAKAS